ncbi:transposase [Acidihalobacter ferrooxydans]|uniref:Transposase IS4-like domain-containing protein n=1 Tax=Acidihalobacter ferrooxydans TaxID=1765967 RepID=A0A1P8UHN0_9GAMM|nr:transposase [Acidihalobacter ferrooxydans]APZ43345.1 hypothetical protein BW247_09785 [Acidihalobacter ferrooxydans]
MNKNGLFFVTRQRKNTAYKVIEHHPVIKAKGVTCEQTIELTGLKAKRCPIRLRPIGYRDGETGKHSVFLTNNFSVAAITIAQIYKARWQTVMSYNRIWCLRC